MPAGADIRVMTGGNWMRVTYAGRPPSGDRCRYPMRVDEVVAY